jgi:PAS domain S-box-containing protein
MAAGLSTPLHLAASLLALAAAVGLALLALVRGGPRPPGVAQRRSDGTAPAVGSLLVVAGALAIAVGHALAGALVDAGDVVAWLRAGGLVLIACGRLPGEASVARTRLPVLGRLRGANVLVPVAPLPAAAVAVAAGTVGALRALLGGRQTALAGVALAAWGAAEALERVSVTSAAWTTVAGALALGAWLWQRSARRLLAKVVIAFVASLLVLVLSLAGVLGSVGSRELVDEELDRLGERSARLSEEITTDWLRDALADAVVVQRSEQFRALAATPIGDEALARLFAAFFREQDFFAVLNPAGQVVNLYVAADDAPDAAFGLALAGSAVADALLSEVTEASDVVTVGGQIVSLAGVRLELPDPRAGDPPLGALVTGRIAGPLFAEQAAEQLGFGVVIAVADDVSAASSGVRDAAPALLGALDDSDEAVADVSGETLYAAAAPIVDPVEVVQVGTVATVSEDEVLAELELERARLLFLLALVGAVVAGLVAATAASRLVAPIRRLTSAAAAVREGDLSAQAEIATEDEVGELGRTFNEMTASLAAQSSQLLTAATTESRLRARLEALTASMGDALVAVDPDGRVVTFNPAAERLVGRAANDVIGRPLPDVLPGKGAGEVSAAAALGAATSEDETAAQLLLRTPDGRYVPTAASAAPVRDADGTVLGRVLVLRDVTREAELERMKSEFLSNVSHELRTPLTPIKGYASVLCRGDVEPPQAQQFAREILASTARMERVVGMIVEFAALDSGRVTLRPEPTELTTLVGDLLAAWRGRHPDREFRRRIAQGLPPALVDGPMLRRCLDELVDNAVKFSPGGEPVSVVAGLEEAADGQCRIRLSVRDRGVGIEPDAAAGIFSDFFQGDASETRHFGGLGLGLALVRRIVDGLGADIEVASEPARGSTFSLLLPVADTLVRHP